mgnify:CR=1 FL=1
MVKTRRSNKNVRKSKRQNRRQNRSGKKRKGRQTRRGGAGTPDTSELMKENEKLANILYDIEKIHDHHRFMYKASNDLIIRSMTKDMPAYTDELNKREIEARKRVEEYRKIFCESGNQEKCDREENVGEKLKNDTNKEKTPLPLVNPTTVPTYPSERAEREKMLANLDVSVSELEPLTGVSWGVISIQNIETTKKRYNEKCRTYEKDGVKHNLSYIRRAIEKHIKKIVEKNVEAVNKSTNERLKEKFGKLQKLITTGNIKNYDMNLRDDDNIALLQSEKSWLQNKISEYSEKIKFDKENFYKLTGRSPDAKITIPEMQSNEEDNLRKTFLLVSSALEAARSRVEAEVGQLAEHYDNFNSDDRERAERALLLSGNINTEIITRTEEEEARFQQWKTVNDDLEKNQGPLPVTIALFAELEKLNDMFINDCLRKFNRAKKLIEKFQNIRDMASSSGINFELPPHIEECINIFSEAKKGPQGSERRPAWRGGEEARRRRRAAGALGMR